MILPGLLLALQLSGTHDEKLPERLKRRDPEAMKEIYDRFGRLVWSVIFAIVRDASIAEDLAQETFLRAWNRAQGFETGRGALGPWLLAIARNRAIDHVRSVSSRMDRSSCEFDAMEHPSFFVDMESEILDRNHGSVVRGAITRLDANQRRVIELAYYEGLSQTEMAERLGQPLGTVKTWVRSALKTLRRELGGGEAT